MKSEFDFYADDLPRGEAYSGPRGKQSCRQQQGTFQHYAREQDGGLISGQMRTHGTRNAVARIKLFAQMRERLRTRAPRLPSCLRLKALTDQLGQRP